MFLISTIIDLYLLINNQTWEGLIAINLLKIFHLLFQVGISPGNVCSAMSKAICFCIPTLERKSKFIKECFVICGLPDVPASVPGSV